MDNFINSMSEKINTIMTDEMVNVEKNRGEIKSTIKERMKQEGDNDFNWFQNNVVYKYEKLNNSEIPTAGQFELEIVRRWMQQIQGSQHEGAGIYSTKGWLYFKIMVDEEQKTYSIDETSFVGGAYANTLLEVLQNDVYRNINSVSMEELKLDSLVHIESEQNSSKKSNLKFNSGKTFGRDDPWKLFSKYVKHLPKDINIQNLKAKQKVYT